MKTHYELLGLERTADADAVKKAFRREIARYHPDKVIHLGAEFQEMAATRAAELTVAYKTLTDAALREEYDASIDAGLPPPHIPAPPPEPPRAEPHQPPPIEDTPVDAPLPPTGGKGRFAAERADRDLILKRAIAGRVMASVEGLYGKVETPAVRGFDLVLVPTAKPLFLGAAPPRVLMRMVDVADAAAITDAYAAAAKTRVHAAKSPVVVLLFANSVAPEHQLSKAHDANARQRRPPDGPKEIAVVVVGTSDWSCHLPPNCSPAVQKLAAQICS